jgi:hypothetical protein
MRQIYFFVNSGHAANPQTYESHQSSNYAPAHENPVSIKGIRDIGAELSKYFLKKVLLNICFADASRYAGIATA